MRGMRAIPWPEAETGASPNLPSGNSPIHQAKEMLASCSSFISRYRALARHSRTLLRLVLKEGMPLRAPVSKDGAPSCFETPTSPLGKVRSSA
jgi:hypothetical protein